MASSYTTNKLIEKPANGDYANTWSTPVNNDWDIIDASLGGTTSLVATGISGTVTLTSTQYRPPNIVITGSLTANVVYSVPSGKGGVWTVYNNTSGAYTVTFASAGGGTSVALQQGYRTQVVCDGTNVSLANNVIGTVPIVNGGTGATTASTAINNLLPTQTGNAGYYLTTNGSTASWAAVSGGGGGGSGTVTNIATTGSVNGITLTGGPITTTGTITLGGALTGVSLTSQVAGVLPVANGGTGLSAYTANGVFFASATNTMTNGSSLTFDGINLGVGTASPSYKLDVIGQARLGGTTGLIAGVGTGFVAGQAEIYSTGTTPMGIGTVGSKELTFNTNGTERARIDSSGNFGIGTPSPGVKLDVNGSIRSNASILINSPSGADFLNTNSTYTVRMGIGTYGITGTVIGTDGANSLIFATNSAEKMRLDSSGNLLLNNGSALAWKNSGGTSLNMLAVDGGNNFLYGYSGSFAGLHAWYSNSIQTMTLSVGGTLSLSNSLTLQGGSSGLGLASGNASQPTVFYIGQFGVSAAEKARIDTSGNLLIGYTSSNGSYLLQVNSQIFATNSTIATSDARYKENVETLSGALDVVNALRPVSFDWKEHPVHHFDRTSKNVGFIAQEVQQALANKPYLNSVIKTNETQMPDGSTEQFLGIAEGHMIAILMAAVKEQQAIIEQLKSDVTDLKSRA